MPYLSLLFKNVRPAAPAALLVLTAALAGCAKPFGDLGDLGDSEGVSGTDSTDGPMTDGETAVTTTDAGPEGPPDEWDDELAPQPGTRLRPVVVSSEDGTVEHVAWHDSELDMTCTFGVTDDGVRRCYPVDQAVFDYADPACTEPVTRPYPSEFGPSKVVHTRVYEGSCYAMDRFYALTPFSGVRWTLAGGDCIEIGDDPGFFRATELPATAFVAAEFVPADGTSRIVPLIAEAEDGARAIAGAWDREHGQEVTARPGADDLRWFDRHEAVSHDFYAEADCETRVAASVGCEPPGTVLSTAVRRVQEDCVSVEVERFRLGEEIDPPGLFSGEGGTCDEHDTSGFSRFWSVTATLTDQDFGLATSHQAPGPRLSRVLTGNPEGEPFLATGDYFDAAIDDVCRFTGSEGQLICLPPVRAFADNSYVDAACTQQVAWLAHDGCEPEPPVWAVGTQDGGPRLHRVLEKTQAWGGFRRIDGACVPDDVGPPGGGPLALYTVSAPLPDAPVSATHVVQ